MDVGTSTTTVRRVRVEKRISLQPSFYYYYCFYDCLQSGPRRRWTQPKENTIVPGYGRYYYYCYYYYHHNYNIILLCLRARAHTHI